MYLWFLKLNVFSIIITYSGSDTHDGLLFVPGEDGLYLLETLVVVSVILCSFSMSLIQFKGSLLVNSSSSLNFNFGF